MKQLIIYDSATGKILSVQRKKYDYVDIVSGTAVIEGDTLSGIQVSAGDLGLALVGSSIFVAYDAVKKIPSKRLAKDEEGNTVLKGGMPVVEDFLIDMTWKDFVDTTIKTIAEDTITLTKAPAETPGPSVEFKVVKQEESTGFSVREVSVAIENAGDLSASALKIDAEFEVKPLEWKVDPVTQRLVKLDTITYE